MNLFFLNLKAMWAGVEQNFQTNNQTNKKYDNKHKKK